MVKFPAVLVKAKPQVVHFERPNTTISVATGVAVKLLALETNPAADPAPTRAVAPAAAAGDSANAATRHDGLLARERAVLGPARAALAAGESARALESAERHARLFPSGVMSEEREAIAINALVTLGQSTQARKCATTFRTRYPQSLLTHSVDAAIAAIPKQ